MKAVIIIVLATLSISSIAQESKKETYIPMASHGIGISFQKFEGLNSRIADYPQYQSLREYAGTLQLGILKERNRVISDMGILAGSSMSGDRDKKSSTIRFVGVQANAGYDVLKSEKIMLYPLAGLGYEMYQARFFRDNSAVPFDDVLETPAVQNNIRSVDFKNSFFTYNLGLGIALFPGNNAHGSIGLKAMYTGSFKSRAWRSSENQTLQNAPEDNLGRIHLALVFSKKSRYKRE